MEDVEERYAILELLGSGAFGRVYKCENRETGQLAAVKSIDKSMVDNVKTLTDEVAMLKEVKHPHIIELYEVFEDDSYLHLVTELCTGGELFDAVMEKAESPEGHFCEDDAALIIRDILTAIQYCHEEVNIVHRDLKPENFLLKKPGDDGSIKLIDFGLARHDNAPQGVMSTRVGTPYYVAPEVLSRSYTFKCDIWSIGVVCYLLLCGFAPFSGDSDYETMTLVKTAALVFPSPEWDTISDDAKDFIRSLLQRDPDQRPTAAKALQHPWISQHVREPGLPRPRPFAMNKHAKSEASVIDFSTYTSRQTAFQKFLGGLKMQKAIGVTTSRLLDSSETEEMKEIFRKVDKNNDGVINAVELEEAISAEETFSVGVRENFRAMKSILSQCSKNPHRFPATFNIQTFVNETEKRAVSI